MYFDCILHMLTINTLYKQFHMPITYKFTHKLSLYSEIPVVYLIPWNRVLCAHQRYGMASSREQPETLQGHQSVHSTWASYGAPQYEMAPKMEELKEGKSMSEECPAQKWGFQFWHSTLCTLAILNSVLQLWSFPSIPYDFFLKVTLVSPTWLVVLQSSPIQLLCCISQTLNLTVVQVQPLGQTLDLTTLNSLTWSGSGSVQVQTIEPDKFNS